MKGVRRRGVRASPARTRGLRRCVRQSGVRSRGAADGTRAAEEALGLGVRGSGPCGRSSRRRRRDPGAARVRRRGRGAGAARGRRAAGAAAEGARSGSGDLFTDDRHERVIHALGKAYRDVVRGFRGEFENPPDLVALPRDESEVEAVLELGRGRGRGGRSPSAAAPASSAASRPRLGERPCRLARPAPARPRARGRRRVSLAARIQAGATGPALEEQLREHGLTLRHFPQSFEYSTLGGWIATRAGGHFATLYTHIDDLVESVRAITPRGTWESRRLPGSGAGPSPDRVLIGSEGILGVITEAWVRVRPRPGFKVSVRGRVRRLPRRGAGAVRAISQSGLQPGQLPPARRARRRGPPAPGRGEQSLLVLGFESAHHPVDDPIEHALEIAARPRRRAGERPRRAASRASGEARVGEAATRSAPGATPSCWRPTCATPSSPAASSPTPSRRRSPGTASRTSTRR